MEPFDLQLQQVDVLQPLVVVEVPPAEDGLLDPDLLIEQSTFIITLQQLFAETIPLSDDLKMINN